MASVQPLSKDIDKDSKMRTQVFNSKGLTHILHISRVYRRNLMQCFDLSTLWASNSTSAGCVGFQKFLKSHLFYNKLITVDCGRRSLSFFFFHFPFLLMSQVLNNIFLFLFSIWLPLCRDVFPFVVGTKPSMEILHTVCEVLTLERQNFIPSSVSALIHRLHNEQSAPFFPLVPLIVPEHRQSVFTTLCGIKVPTRAVVVGLIVFFWSWLLS